MSAPLPGGPLGLALAALHGAALLAAAAAVLPWLARAGRAALAPAACALAGLAGLAAVLALVPPASLPPAWVTALHEGTTRDSLAQLTAGGTHAGLGFGVVAALFGVEPATGLPALARMNLALTVLGAGLYLAVAARLLPRRPLLVAAAGLAYALNPLTLNAAFSELPSPLLAVLTFLGVACLGPLADDGPRARPRLALAALALLAACAATARAELALLGGAAVTVAALRVRLGPDGLDRLGDRGRAALRAVAAWPRRRQLALLAAVLLVWATVLPLDGTTSPLRWLWAGLQPLNPSILALPGHLWLYLPLAVAGALTLGLAHALVHPLRTYGAGLAVVVLFRTYFRAGHLGQAWFEMLRYLTLLAPALFVLGLLSVRFVAEDLRAPAWPPLARLVAAVVAAMSLFVWPLDGDVSAEPVYRSPAWNVEGLEQSRYAFPPLVDRSPQREVRFLLEATRRWPRCAFVARVAGPAGRIPPRVRETQVATFGAGLAAPAFAPDDGRPLAEQVRRPPPGASCLLFYRGLDCSLVEMPPCDAAYAGLVAVDAREEPAAPYVFGRTHGHLRPRVRMEVLAVPGAPPPP